MHKISEGRFVMLYSYTFLGSKYISEHELILNKDSTFSLELRYPPIVINKCQGRWYYLDNRNIHLKCYESSIPMDTCKESATPVALIDPSWVKGYMQTRERNVKVINENKIHLEIPENERRKYILMKRCIKQ